MPREVTIRAEADEELLDQVEKIAESRGITPPALVGEALRRLVEYDKWFIEQVELARKDVAEGRVVSHEEVMAEMRRRFG